MNGDHIELQSNETFLSEAELNESFLVNEEVDSNLITSSAM